METTRTALVLGATGGIGGAIAAALLAHGWRVRGMARKPPAPGTGGLDWAQGDAMRPEDVLAAATGACAIVHAVNPPGYRRWDRLVLPMLESTISAARATGARIVLPGTIYNFDPEAVPVIEEDSPQRPRSRKGRIRVALEARLREASAETPVLILRAGDFFGPGARSSWFAQAMISPGRPLARITEIARGPGHSWAYLPDLAEAFARLMDMPDRLRPFEVLQFEGLCDADGETLTRALENIAGRPLPRRRPPWGLLRLLAPFGGFPREAAEIEPHWTHPVRLCNTRLTALLGAEPRTPLDLALRRTLAAMEATPEAARLAA